MEETINLIIVDDHPLAANGFKLALSDHSNIKVTGCYTNADDLYKHLINERPDIILMDVDLPGKSGIEITREITQNHPEIRVIILSYLKKPFYILESFKAGTRAYLPKDVSEDELVKTIYSVLKNNGRYFGETIPAGFWDKHMKIRHNIDEGLKRLTRTQNEILNLCAAGYSSKEISEMRKITVSAVDTHKRDIRFWFPGKPLIYIVALAVEQGFVKLSTKDSWD